MSIKEILQNSKTVAVVGLSPDESKASHYVSKFMQEKGYKIYPIYPKEETILGEKVYRNLSEIKDDIDIVLMFRKGEFASEIIDDVINKGAKTFWLQLGIKNEEAKAKALNNGINFVQDRCIMVEYKKKMKDYKHITKYENILNDHLKTIKKLEKWLNKAENLEYKELIEYYYSDQRDRDLKDDSKGKIPENLPRGVLSEDGIYNMIMDYKDIAFKMLEVATKMLKA